jgi:hypothetical protein
MLASLYLLFRCAILCERGAYRTAGDAQLDQPKEYWLSSPFVENAFEEYIQVHTINGLNKTAISLGVINQRNMRSKKVDCLVMDELAFVDSHQEQAIRIGRAMLKNAADPHLIYISTPRIGTEYERIYKRLEPKHSTTWYPYEVVQGSWLNKQEIIAERDKMPAWEWLQEYRALWSTPGGTLFTNVILGDHGHATVEKVGVDFHGEYGSVVVGVQFEDDRCYVTHTCRYPNPSDKLDLSWLKAYHCPIIVEDGGYNAGYARAAKAFGAQGEIASAERRALQTTQARTYQILIDPQQHPELAEDLRISQWDPQGRLIPVKDEAHPNHYLDAFLLCFVPYVKLWITGTPHADPGLSRIEHLRQQQLGHL